MAGKYKESEQPNASQSSSFDRRSFLKLSATGLALPPASLSLTATAKGVDPPLASPAKGEPLPASPSRPISRVIG